MLSIVTGTIGFSVAILIVILIRKDRLHVNHGLGWLLVAATFALVGIYPQLVDNIAKTIGIAYPPMLALTIAVAALVLKILVMDIERSRLEARNQRLVQRLAILEADIRMLTQRLPSTTDVKHDVGE